MDRTTKGERPRERAQTIARSRRCVQPRSLDADALRRRHVITATWSPHRDHTRSPRSRSDFSSPVSLVKITTCTTTCQGEWRSPGGSNCGVSATRNHSSCKSSRSWVISFSNTSTPARQCARALGAERCRTSLRVLQRVIQPGPRKAPIPLHGCGRQLQHLANLLRRQSTEELELDDAPGTRIEDGQSFERFM